MVLLYDHCTLIVFMNFTIIRIYAEKNLVKSETFTLKRWDKTSTIWRVFLLLTYWKFVKTTTVHFTFAVWDVALTLWTHLLIDILYSRWLLLNSGVCQSVRSAGVCSRDYHVFGIKFLSCISSAFCCLSQIGYMSHSYKPWNVYSKLVTDEKQTFDQVSRRLFASFY